MRTFEEYLDQPFVLDFDQMQRLHKDLLAEIGNDPDALDIYNDLLDTCEKYASIRAKWQRLSLEEKMEKDPSRTSCHNSVIIHFNMLSRYLRMQGKQTVWRDQLGYEEKNKYYRKTIGDFACYIVFINSLCAR